MLLFFQKKHHPYNLFSTNVSPIYVFLVMLMFKMDSKGGVEVLSGVTKLKKAVMCFMEKNNLDKLPSGMSYIAVGCEIYVNESTKHITYGVFKRKHTYNKATY